MQQPPPHVSVEWRENPLQPAKMIDEDLPALQPIQGTKQLPPCHVFTSRKLNQERSNEQTMNQGGVIISNTAQTCSVVSNFGKAQVAQAGSCP